MKGVIQTGLIAGDAGGDEVGFACLGLGHEVGIGKEGSRHADHIGAAVGQDLFRRLRVVDPVRGDDRDRDLTHQLFRDPSKRPARHACGDRRDARLVPADAGVDDRRPCLLDGLGQRHDLVPCRAVRHQIDHRQAIDEDELGPNRLAHAADHFDRQAHPVFERAAPAVGSLVGVGNEELVEEIALGPHDLDPIIPRLAGTGG